MRLFQKHDKNNLKVHNRVVMAPMTRARNEKGIYNALNAEYYRQRAGEMGAGLIITEAINIADDAIGMVFVPGIFTPEMILGAKLVTDAVHKKGSKIFAQIWHVGRISHTSLHPQNLPPKGPSHIKGENTFAYGFLENGETGFIPTSEPEALTLDEIQNIIKQFVTAAKNSIDAGFDGIELHGANGYLIEQFINPHVNNRSDQYGGSIKNRVQFLLDVLDAVADEIGYDKIGVRISPYGTIQALPTFEEAEETFLYIAQELSKRNIAYTHLMDQMIGGNRTIPEEFLLKFRKSYHGNIILAGGMTKDFAEKLIQNNIIDLAAFGAPFIANPDLSYRLQNNLPMNEPHRETFFGGNEVGYTDYPFYKH